MAVIKNNKTGMWEVRTYYKDLTGARKQKTKRGFAKKSEALEWERNFKLKEDQSISMSFKSFVDIYLTDLEPRIKRNTFLTKKHYKDETGYSKYFKYAMQKKKCRNSRGRDMPRPCAYACEDTTKFKCFKFCRVFEREKYTHDLRTPCKFKIQMWKSPFLVQRILRRYCRENAKKIQEYIQNQLQNINVNIKMYIFDHLRMYIFAILPLDRYIFLSDKIFL